MGAGREISENLLQTSENDYEKVTCAMGVSLRFQNKFIIFFLNPITVLSTNRILKNLTFLSYTAKLRL